MQIAYIHQHFSTKAGATGTRSYEMAKRLIAAGHSVTMICGVSDVTANSFNVTGRVNEMDIDGIRVFCIAAPYSNKMGFYRRLLAFKQFADTAAKIVTSLHSDLVFATSTPLSVGLPGMKGARKLGVPFVFEVRDLWPELPIAMGIIKNPGLKWYTRHLERKIYRAAHRIIALAPGIKEGICKTGYRAEQVAMIPNGCDLDVFKPSDEPLTDPRFGAPDDFKLVFTGAHGEANGLHAVLDAAQVLKQRNATGLQFVFIGEGKLKPGLVERSKQQGLDSLVKWVPSMPKAELAALQPRFNVGMMILKNIPSFYYGTSPNKFFDYISSGMPVLNNYPGWLAGMIKQHNFGYCVPPDDPVAFADAVLWLRCHRDQKREMGNRARKLAETQFSRDRLGAEFVGVLEEARRSFKK